MLHKDKYLVPTKIWEVYIDMQRIKIVKFIKLILQAKK